MDKKKENREYLSEKLIRRLCELGYPYEFGVEISRQLGTEKTIGRMLSYLEKGKPSSAEEIADEMIAICDERDAWIRKKKAEYYNSQYNMLLLKGLDDPEEEE